jgi:ADP-heptose:LPS heptosyltransferase
MRTLVIQLGRLGDVIATTPLLKDLLESRSFTDFQDEIDLLVVHPNQQSISGLRGLSQIRAVPEELKTLDNQIAAGFPLRAVPCAATEWLHDLALPKYDRVINASHAALGCWLAGHIPCDHREGGVIDDQGECLYVGAAHIYRVALLAFREQNQFNAVDLLRSAARPHQSSNLRSRLHVDRSPALPFALPAGRKVALNVGASEAQRVWPTRYFARLAEDLVSYGLVPMLVGAPSDRDACAEVQSACATSIPNFAGRTSIPEMATLLSEVDLLISGDTGAVHIASAVGTRTLGLYGATAHFAETSPWGEGHFILQLPLGSPMSALAPDLVLLAALARLGLVHESSLRSEFIRRRQRAWETCFLPPGCDPLGGLSYRPLLEDTCHIEDLFARAVRHIFAQEFCGSTENLSLDYTDNDADQAGPPKDLLQRMAPTLHALEAMADAARSCCRADPYKIEVIAPLLTRSMEVLLASTSKPCALPFRPVVHYLDWKLRMMPLLTPGETLARHAREFRNAASMLCRAAALVSDSILNEVVPQSS